LARYTSCPDAEDISMYSFVRSPNIQLSIRCKREASNLTLRCKALNN
jgi:hypothetical protein